MATWTILCWHRYSNHKVLAFSAHNHIILGFAPIAQLDNASASEAGDCRFESRWVRHPLALRYSEIFLKGTKMKRFLLLSILLLTACNSVYVKPGSMDKSQTVYATRGGYGMRRSIKESLEKRGYTVVVGKLKNNSYFGGDDISGDIEQNEIPHNARYIIKTAERKEKFNPFWCPFNGFWWWNFNVSIADQQTGAEIMTWRGRGCAHSSIRKLNDILDTLEK